MEINPAYKILLFCALSGMLFSNSLRSLCEANERNPESTKKTVVELNQGMTIRVLWTVSEYYVLENAEWGEGDAKKLLFNPLDITPSSITFDGQTCNDVTFTLEVVDTVQYLAERYNIPQQSLGLDEKTVRVIRSNCLLPGFAEYIRLPDRRLIISIHGVLFFFEPAINY